MALNHLDNDLPYHDSLASHFAWIPMTGNFDAVRTIVVINGILIAFYLNNWAIQQQRKNEIAILKEIKSDISSSLEDLVEEKMVMDSAYQSTRRVINYLKTVD